MQASATEIRNRLTLGSIFMRSKVLKNLRTTCTMRFPITRIKNRDSQAVAEAHKTRQPAFKVSRITLGFKFCRSSCTSSATALVSSKTVDRSASVLCDAVSNISFVKTAYFVTPLLQQFFDFFLFPGEQEVAVVLVIPLTLIVLQKMNAVKPLYSALSQTAPAPGFPQRLPP